MSTAQNVTLPDLAAALATRDPASRIIVALVGAPGSGKSTTAELLRTALQKDHGQDVQVVPMDGFHFDDAVLMQLGRRDRKGAPDTFDVGGLDQTLARLAAAYQREDVAVPVFDRKTELSRASARLIDRKARILIVEGNYLLLDQTPWDQLGRHFTTSVMIACAEETLRARLMQRWTDLDFTLQDASRKVDGNDLPNARLVIAQSRAADYVLTQ